MKSADRKKHRVPLAAVSIVMIFIFLSGCTRRVEVRREWPMPLKISPAIIKQCSAIHNRTCPERSGEIADAIYYFDKRKLPEIETQLINSEQNSDVSPEERMLLKKIESASAYSATFIRTECSIEYYVQGKNVTCEVFLNYIDKLRKECSDCLEVIKIDPEKNAPQIMENPYDKLFFE